MPKPTITVTFLTRAPYTLTRDVRLSDGTLVEGVGIHVERVHQKGKARDPNREYGIEAFAYDVPHEVDLEQEQLNELFDILDDFVLKVEWWLEGGDNPTTANHVIDRTHKTIRPGQQISL